MSSRLVRSLTATLAALLLAGAGIAGQGYRGFTIDDDAVAGQPDLAKIVAATREQIDMVHAVGLPPETLAFCQQVKFRLVPAGSFKSPTPGRYTGRAGRAVEVSAGIVRVGHKPVLLHELMHAYHDQRIAKGYNNPDILALYEAARAIPAFAAKSHMMSNAREYFACIATTHLFGVTAQEPFNRQKLGEHQPAGVEYLRSLFGPDSARYEGSLSEPPTETAKAKP